MSTPTYCTSCGHDLGVGRFCTNCGKPVPGRHPEAAPTVVAPAPAPGPVPVVPPPVGQLPPAPRYPLFADAAPTVTGPSGPPPAHPPPPPSPVRERSTPLLPWVITLVALAVVAGIGGFLLLGTGNGDGDGDGDGDRGRDQSTGAVGQPGDGPSTEPERPDASGTEGIPDAPDPADVVDLTPEVTAEVPAVAAPSRDRRNQPVRYDATNMWDGDPRTAWRMAGDGTGTTLTFDLGQDVVITEVGLINGYAKVDGPDDWYLANRRVSAVQWEFDDGTRVTQDLAEKQTMQEAMIGPIATRTIRIHLLTVTDPGQGGSGRDFTAISEVRFRGAPAP